jgi:hypothetical protein
VKFSESPDPVEVCDDCDRRLRLEGPTPVGWRILGFTCKRCGKEFCSHLDAGGLVCEDCARKATTRRDMREGSAHWPRVDGTAASTDRAEIEYSPPGRAWRVAALWAGIALIFVAMLWLVLNGSGR